jgi:hypothetical protein
VAVLEQIFPQLTGTAYQVTSPATPGYNCIAWAAGDESRWWEPDTFGLYHWPAGVPRLYTLDAFVEAFRQLGFEKCSDGSYQPGWEKVVIFTKAERVPTHMCRQLQDGGWTSKLGKLEDITHRDVSHLSGQSYGTPTVFMRRRLTGTSQPPPEPDP